MPDITPNDIINKEFRRGLRGYDTEQVDDFLQEVSERLFRALEENQRLRAQVEDLRTRLQRYQETEELLKNTLVLAERTADDTRQRAREEAELIRREAMVGVEAERTTLSEVRQTRARIIAELRAMLRAHLALLDTQDGQPTQGATPDIGGEEL